MESYTNRNKTIVWRKKSIENIVVLIREPLENIHNTNPCSSDMSACKIYIIRIIRLSFYNGVAIWYTIRQLTLKQRYAVVEIYFGIAIRFY